MPILTATNIKKSFGGAVALSDGNLHCDSGKITGLLGSNGSGKSTVSKIICGVYTKDAGSVVYKGKEVTFKNPQEGRNNGISMVFQNLSLLNDMTIWQNIFMGREEKKHLFLDDKKSIRMAQEIMDNLMPGLDVRRKVSSLNPGEKQITEIAKALSCKPEVLFLDEPTAALEQKEVQQLFKYMRQLAKEGVAMIFTSHRTHEVMEICDEVIVFRNGKNVGEIDFSKEGRDVDRVLEMILGGKTIKRERKEYKKFDGEPVMQVESLSYGRILNNVTFNLRKGEVLGIGGLSGQGQTELMLALAGNYPETTGSIKVKNKSINTHKPVQGIREGVLLVPGDRLKEGLFADKSIYFNMIYAKLGLEKQPVFTPKKKYRQEAEKVCEELSVRMRDIDQEISGLSGGNQQKIVVGKWLPLDINVMLLADPAKGVDIGAKNDLYAYIINLVEKENLSVILYASDNEELVDYCDRVLVMYEGAIVAELEGEEITEDNITAHSMHIE